MTTERRGSTMAAGERLRRTRIAIGRSRQSVGDEIGASASMIGRMERGEGDGILVRRWVAAGDALGLRLTMSLDIDRERTAALSLPRRVLTADSIRRLALPGGWRVEHSDPFRATLVRDARSERLLVYLCDRPIEILDAADARGADRATASATLTDDWRVGLLIVVRAELRDRYRAMDWMAGDLDAFQTTGSPMIAALRGPRVRMPDRDVLVWCDDAATRLIPLGLDLEPGRRARRRRPEVRRAACPRRP